MANLTILEQESLGILKQLEYCCDSAKLRNSEVKQEVMKHSEDFYEDDIIALNLALLKQNKFLIIPYSEIDFSVLKKHMDIHNVEKYLQENGVRFHLSLDFIFDDPTILEVSEDPYAIYSELGIINGESIEEIKTKIQILIDKLENKENGQRGISITYNINIGKFIFNGKDVCNVSGNQKSVSDCLVEAGENKNVSWDILNEKITGFVGEVLNNHEMALAKKTVHSAVTEINKKTEKYLEPEKLLIDFKESEYWLQYPIHKNE